MIKKIMKKISKCQECDYIIKYIEVGDTSGYVEKVYYCTKEAKKLATLKTCDIKGIKTTELEISIPKWCRLDTWGNNDKET